MAVDGLIIDLDEELEPALPLPGWIPTPVRQIARASEPYQATVAFVAGFGYDSATLRRIDQLFDNLLLLAYLVLLGLLLVVDLRLRHDRPEVLGFLGPRLSEGLRRREGWLQIAIQFLFGGLYSAYVIFYMKSVSPGTTLLFLAPLVGLLVFNEAVGRRVRIERLELALYFFCVFSFLLYFVPVATGWLGRGIFWAAALGAAFAVAAVVWAIYRDAEDMGPEERRARVLGHAIACASLVAGLVGLDALRAIPPVPLSLVHGGVYHKVERDGAAFRLLHAAPPWTRFWSRESDPFEPREGSAVHCFTAVFAPAGLAAHVSHRWERWEPESAAWVEQDAIPFRVEGGRDRGFRGTTRKRHYSPGHWRVRVMLEEGWARGREIGHVPFRILPPREGPSPQPLRLASVLYE